MPMFTIERSYLVPVYQHVTIEASDVATACAAALDEDNHPWDNDKVDYESARETTVSGAWAGATAYDGACLLGQTGEPSAETIAAPNAAQTPTGKHTFACPHCAGTNITWDAITRWDVPTQSNVIVALLDCGSCDDCACEIKQADQISIDETTEPPSTSGNAP